MFESLNKTFRFYFLFEKPKIPKKPIQPIKTRVLLKNPVGWVFYKEPGFSLAPAISAHERTKLATLSVAKFNLAYLTG